MIHIENVRLNVCDTKLSEDRYLHMEVNVGPSQRR